MGRVVAVGRGRRANDARRGKHRQTREGRGGNDAVRLVHANEPKRSKTLPGVRLAWLETSRFARLSRLLVCDRRVPDERARLGTGKETLDQKDDNVAIVHIALCSVYNFGP